jgi:hypothetical protein
MRRRSKVKGDWDMGDPVKNEGGEEGDERR